MVTFLSTATTWTIRDRLARLTQIVTLLNIENLAEVGEYWGPNASSVTWKLTSQEVRQILMLRYAIMSSIIIKYSYLHVFRRRTDFRVDDIKRLKL